MLGSEKVQEIVAGVKNFSAVNNIANSTVVEGFKTLINILQAQEEIFLSKLGFSSIDQLNSTLSSISSNLNLTALNAGGSIYRQIESRCIFKGSNQEKTSQNVEENIFNLLTELLQKEGIKADSYLERYLSNYGPQETPIYNAFMDALTDAFNGITVDGNFIKYIFTARGTNSSTGYYKKNPVVGQATIKLNLNKAIDKGQISIKDGFFVVNGDPSKFSASVEKEIREVIRPELMRRLEKTVTGKLQLSLMSQQEIRDFVNEVIMQNGIRLNNEDLAMAQNIAIGAGAGNISGYLGELQGYLLFKQLFANVSDSEIINSGASYINSLSGAAQMDPADLVIKISDHLFNIQIKNYKKGGAEWGGATSKLFGDENVRELSTATSFLTERLQLQSNTLLNYFGAVTFHNLNPQYQNEPSYQSYKNLYGQLLKIFNDLKPSFDTFLPNIIRLKTILEGGEEVFENFYFQKGQIITASSILKGILQQLQNPNIIDKIFSAKYAMFPGASHYIHTDPYDDNYVKYASETYIQWSVRMTFSNLKI